jgi:SAM-dependent methyltransferase
MLSDPNLDYKESFFKNRHKLAWRAPVVCKPIVKYLKPKSLLDAGCATGDLVAEFVALGVDAYGLEGSHKCIKFLECSITRVFFFDLRQPVPLSRRYDLVTCFEVAEHVDPDCSHQFVENLCGLSDRVLMSAAPPGQGGHHHVNCQDPEYWQIQFGYRGYERVPWVEQALKAAWQPWSHKPGVKAYYDNLLYFCRSGLSPANTPSPQVGEGRGEGAKS